MGNLAIGFVKVCSVCDSQMSLSPGARADINSPRAHVRKVARNGHADPSTWCLLFGVNRLGGRDSLARFVIGDDRSQSTLFPERLDDYLSEDNPVRAIDVFVYELDLLSRSRFIGVTDLSARAGRGGRV